MKLRPLITTSAVTLGVLVSATACAPEAAPAPETSSAGTIVDEWRMTSLEVASGDNYETVPYSGRLIFTEAGTLSVQAMNPDLAAADTAYTLGGYEAYYGPVTIDVGDGTFEIEVESAVTRDIIGQTLTRNFEVSADTLVLTPEDPTEGWRVTYERE